MHSASKCNYVIGCAAASPESYRNRIGEATEHSMSNLAMAQWYALHDFTDLSFHR
jgi:hypothetical protein